jgi:hypothetical protein
MVGFFSLFTLFRSFMTQKRARGRSQSSSISQPDQSDYHSARQPVRQKRFSTPTASRERHQSAWADSDAKDIQSDYSGLTSLIEQDAPLKSNTALVLMYGPFQAEMGSETPQGVASWLQDCIRKHGIPSLVRFDYRHRAQVYRRDQFQPWLDQLVTKLPNKEVG